MKKFLLILLPIFFFSCADKLTTARTTVGFVGLGVSTARQVIASVASMNHANCLKKGDPSSKEYFECYKKTKEMLDATKKLWPQLDQALILATSAIKAATEKKAGVAVDYITPIRQSVCLLTKLVTWLPKEYQMKVQQWINLAGQFTCDKTASVTQEKGFYLVTKLQALLIQLGAKA